MIGHPRSPDCRCSAQSLDAEIKNTHCLEVTNLVTHILAEESLDRTDKVLLRILLELDGHFVPQLCG
jgi:hypothetical protein